MNAILIIAGKEVRDGLRNRWIVGTTLLLAVLAFALAMLGTAPTGVLGVKPLAVTVVSLASLSIFLIPLIALLLSYDSIVGEVEHGTLLLLLTYPVRRGEILLGKVLGHCTILALATLIGYGGAGLAVGLGQGRDPQGWAALALLLVSTVMLGAAFICLATLISLLVRERASAAGLAVAVRLLFVVVFDVAVLGLLVWLKSGLDPALFRWLLICNPADLYRLVNLTGMENIRVFSGMAGLSESLRFSPWLLLALLGGWCAVPLAIALFVFRRREL